MVKLCDEKEWPLSTLGRVVGGRSHVRLLVGARFIPAPPQHTSKEGQHWGRPSPQGSYGVPESPLLISFHLKSLCHWLSSLHGKHQSRASAASSSHTWALWCSESSGEDPWCSSSGIEDISSGKKGSDSTCSVPPTLQTAKTSQAQVRAHVVFYLSHLCVPRKPQTRPGHMGYQ